MNIWGSLFILRLNMEQNSTSLNPQWRERKQISNQQSMKVSFLALAIEIDIIKAQTVSSTSSIISPQNWHSIHIQILYEKHIQRNLVFNFSATRVSPGMVILVDLPLWSRWITMTFSEDIHGSQTSDFSDFVITDHVCITNMHWHLELNFSHVNPPSSVTSLTSCCSPHPIQGDGAGLQGHQQNCTCLLPNTGQTTRPSARTSFHYISWLAGTAITSPFYTEMCACVVARGEEQCLSLTKLNSGAAENLTCTTGNR